MRSLTLCLGCAFAFLLYGGEHKFWDSQDIAAWTQPEIHQFTTASPWAKEVTAVLTSNGSNMAESGARGVSGGRRGGRGGGSSSTTPATEIPKWQALVRWVSAKPMQQLLKPHLPASFDGHYVISVSGLPIAGDTTELVQQTTLQLKRGDAVNPESAFQDPSDKSTIYFAFLPSTIDVSDSKTAIFNMIASPYEVKAKFNLGEMKYLGEPAF